MQLLNFFDAHPAVLIIFIIWSLAWKGFALWKAARLYHRYWFIIILIVNTIGIVDIAYIYFIARPAEKSLPPLQS